MHSPRAAHSLAGVAALGLVALVVAPTASASTAGIAPAALSAAPTSAHQQARAAYQNMTRHQRVGQLFMVGLPSTGTTSSQRDTLRQFHVGNAMLLGHNGGAGVTKTAHVALQLQRASTVSSVRPLLATDQEGGEVQDLTGPGFSTMPTALDQGRLSPSTLRARAKHWGHQLKEAGVNLDFAPVADVVPKSVGTSNQPIGRYYREYGYTPRRVRRHVVAFIRGMRAAGTMTTVKHFPGLGRATGNTDTTTGVTDPTTRHDPYLSPFQAGIDHGVRLVMVSTATYPNIDSKHKAAFSHVILRGMLRHDMGFGGTIVSDALDTVSVQSISPGHRATRFIGAGGDVVLVTSLSPLQPMTHAVLSKMTLSKGFRQHVKDAVMQVLLTKAHAGLL